MTQPHRHNPLDPDPARRLSEHILARTNNGRDIFDGLARIARGDDPRATGKTASGPPGPSSNIKIASPHIFQDPQSLDPIHHPLPTTPKIRSSIH